jgi:hypothetical protein
VAGPAHVRASPRQLQPIDRAVRGRSDLERAIPRQGQPVAGSADVRAIGGPVQAMTGLTHSRASPWPVQPMAAPAHGRSKLWPGEHTAGHPMAGPHDDRAAHGQSSPCHFQPEVGPLVAGPAGGRSNAWPGQPVAEAGQAIFMQARGFFISWPVHPGLARPRAETTTGWAAHVLDCAGNFMGCAGLCMSSAVLGIGWNVLGCA